MCNLQVGVTSGGFRLPAKTIFLKDVTAGHSWSLLILDRELTVSCQEENASSLYIYGTIKVEDYVIFRKMRTQLFFSGCLGFVLDLFFPLNSVHASSITVVRSQKPLRLLVLPLPVKWLCILHQQHVCRCNSCPCMQEFALRLDGWAGTCSKGSLSQFQRKSYWFKWEWDQDLNKSFRSPAALSWPH